MSRSQMTSLIIACILSVVCRSQNMRIQNNHYEFYPNAKTTEGPRSYYLYRLKVLDVPSGFTVASVEIRTADGGNKFIKMNQYYGPGGKRRGYRNMYEMAEWDIDLEDKLPLTVRIKASSPNEYGNTIWVNRVIKNLKDGSTFDLGRNFKENESPDFYTGCRGKGCEDRRDSDALTMDEETDGTDDHDGSPSNQWVLIMVIILIALCVVVMVSVVIMVKKRNKNKLREQVADHEVDDGDHEDIEIEVEFDDDTEAKDGSSETGQIVDIPIIN